MVKYKFRKRNYWIEKHKILIISLLISLILTIITLFPKPKPIIIENRTINEEMCLKKFVMYCKYWKLFGYDENNRPLGGWSNFSKNYYCPQYKDNIYECEEVIKKYE
ncbi:MAG: hypothetical protein RMJ17_02135 [Candidatus Aenigmarchaeota archaeon]|nr:hypothetical protein [Candidatus Aenigmarchaeota archaeon]MDW8149372.1 hypothetical protein [Candidatus Aenigmarchaeota archaeon]